MTPPNPNLHPAVSKRRNDDPWRTSEPDDGVRAAVLVLHGNALGDGEQVRPGQNPRSTATAVSRQVPLFESLMATTSTMYFCPLTSSRLELSLAV